MASASSAHRLSCWEPPAQLPSPVAEGVVLAFWARGWGSVWVWDFMVLTATDTVIPTATAATTTMGAAAIWFGGACGRLTVGEYGAFRCASDRDCSSTPRLLIS